MRTSRKLNEIGPASELKREINILQERADALRIADGLGYSVNRTIMGQVLNLKVGKTIPKDVEIKLFQIVSLSQDYFTGTELNANRTNFKGEDVDILKPWALRPTSSAGAPIGFDQATLDFAGGQSRTLDVIRDVSGTDKTFSVVQTVVPLYVASTTFGLDEGSWIIAASGMGTLGTNAGDEDIKWIDLNVDARHWQMTDAVTEVCVDNKTKYVILPRSGVAD